MSLRSRRLWSPQMPLDTVIREAERLVERCSGHGLLVPTSTPTLFHVHRARGAWPADGMVPLSDALRVGAEPSPSRDRFLAASAAVLAVAIHAHALMQPDALVLDEPLAFPMPDLATPGLSRWGLLYSLAGRKPGDGPITLLVTPWNLWNDSSRRVPPWATQHWGLMLPPHPSRWFERSEWAAEHALAQAAGWLGDYAARRAARQSARSSHPANLPMWGVPAPVPKTHNDLLQQFEAVWHEASATWILPHGQASADHLAWLRARASEDIAHVRDEYAWVCPVYPARRVITTARGGPPD